MPIPKHHRRIQSSTWWARVSNDTRLVSHGDPDPTIPRVVGWVMCRTCCKGWIAAQTVGGVPQGEWLKDLECPSCGELAGDDECYTSLVWSDDD